MLAEIPDLEDELGRPLAEDEYPKALRALRYASNLAASLFPWADWDPSPEGVSDAVAALAARRFNVRTDGLAAVGPFRYGAPGAQTFTGEELTMLNSAGGVAGGSYSISIATPDP